MTEPDAPITLSDLSDVILAVRQTIALFDETPWWRSHAKADWRLEAQVYRENPENPDRSSSAGTALIGHFMSRAPSRSHRPCPAADDYFGWLFLAQHYGLPTCLLDWTESPLVAAYFAVERPDEDGCIWALGPTGLNGALVDLDGLVMMQNPRAKKIAENAMKITPLQAVLRYRDLLQVEDLFRRTKAIMRTRPIFHSSDAAIRGHVFCSFLALAMQKHLDDLLRQAGLVPEWKDLLRDLDRLAQVRIRHRGADWLVRTDAAPHVTRLFKSARITLPPRAHQARPPPAPSKSPRKRRSRPRRSATPI
jgi:hypothetical protein